MAKKKKPPGTASSCASRPVDLSSSHVLLNAQISPANGGMHTYPRSPSVKQQNNLPELPVVALAGTLARSFEQWHVLTKVHVNVPAGPRKQLHDRAARQGCGVGSHGFLFQCRPRSFGSVYLKHPIISPRGLQATSFFPGTNSSRIVLYTLEYVYHIWEIGDLQKPSSTCLAHLTMLGSSIKSETPVA